MSESVKETKEALVGINELALILCKRLKDGVQLADALAVWDAIKNDAEVQAKIVAAYDGISLVKAEVADIDLSEGIELAVMQAQYVPKLVAALKAE